jgi:hypothetical protein
LGAAGREVPLLPALPAGIPDPDAEAAGREVPLLPAPEIGGDPGFGMGRNLLLVEVAAGVVARAGGTGGGALAGMGAGGGALADSGGKSSAAKREVSLPGSAPSHAAGGVTGEGAPGNPGGGGFTRMPVIAHIFGTGAGTAWPASLPGPVEDAVPA